jgi:UDP-N-acetylmuramate dehydrogenase
MNFAAAVSLKDHNSWAVGGSAEFFFKPGSLSELKAAVKEAQARGLAIHVLGGGTNVLVSDQGVRGLVLSLSQLQGAEVLEESPHLKLCVWAGTTKSEILKLLLRRKLRGALFLAGLPGQVGGGVVMNAGVSELLTPREFCEIVEKIEVLKPDGQLVEYEAKNLQWSYRHCEGWKPGVITRVWLHFEGPSDDTIPARVRELNHQRLAKQPLELPSCGSVFRNPLPQHAGRLIELAGLKGERRGGAQISTKHANFIVNTGGAKASEIWELMKLAQSRVRETSGVELQSEVVWLGDGPP